MKKSLLAMTVALMSLAASAQAVTQSDDAQEQNLVGNAPQKAYVEGGKPAPYYKIPAGTFFTGYAKQGYNLNNPIVVVPPYTDLTFTNGSVGATSYQWKYVNPEGEYSMFNPQLTATDENLTVSYSYGTPTVIEAPTLTAINEVGDSTTTALTNAPIYMRVGGGDEKNTNTDTYFGLTNISTKAGTRYYSSNYFATNHPNSATNWKNIGQYDSVCVRGFGEMFAKPAAPLALKGFSIQVREIATITSPIMLTMYKATVNENGVLTGIERIASQTLQPSEMQSDGTSRYYLLFDKLVDAKTQEQVEGYTVDYPILATIVLANENDVTSQMGVYYNSLTVNAPSTAYMILNTTKDGKHTKGIIRNGSINWSGNTYTRSFGMNMLGKFEYIANVEDGANEYTINAPATGAVEAIELRSSVPYAEPLGLATNWTITSEEGVGPKAAPAAEMVNNWVDVSAVDQYDDEYNYKNSTTLTVTVNPNNDVERNCDVKITFLGGEYTIHIAQEGVATGVEDITVAQDDANAPIYNVMGQRVAADAKGILIKNGKKILVK